MQTWTQSDPSRLTRTELFNLHGIIVEALADLPAVMAERESGLASLRNIRTLLAQPKLTPW